MHNNSSRGRGCVLLRTGMLDGLLHVGRPLVRDSVSAALHGRAAPQT
jgi:hypothetical protein